ncbi:hypothetical protein [Candidatus Binatus sp.]|jgi:hypothetical protein|uniref:hypothetical protein n=1 Tax=Candidatus Binatus sp. TaxID=2811406 RepID=UPI003BE96252
MRKTAPIALIAGILLGLTNLARAQTVVTLQVTFHTTSDDKDGDTQVRDRVVSNGADAATLFCCSAGKHSADHWDNDSQNTRTMNMVQPLTKAQLQSAKFVAGSTANGNDKWVFVPTLTATYSDGTTQQWTFPETVLDSNDSHLVEGTYAIPPS